MSRKIRKDKGIPKVKFCPQGHDKDIVGRNSQGKCKECERLNHKKYYDDNKENLLPKLRENNKKRREKIKKIREEIEQKILQEALKRGTKVCSKCKIEKPLDQFSPDKKRFLGVSSYCKDCKKPLSVSWRNRNREAHNAQGRKWHREHKEQSAVNRKRWQRNNIERSRISLREKRHTNIQVKLAWLLRSRLRSALKNNAKKGSAVRDLGCSIEFLKQYLESLWLPGMTWENHGFGQDKWHIDHILPLDSFDLTDREQLLQACHYTNLQPMWQPDNLSKSNKIL